MQGRDVAAQLHSSVTGMKFYLLLAGCVVEHLLELRQHGLTIRSNMYWKFSQHGKQHRTNVAFRGAAPKIIERLPH